MKLTFEIEGRTVVIDDTEAVTLDDALRLMEHVLKGVGYVFDGSLEFVENLNESKGEK